MNERTSIPVQDSNRHRSRITGVFGAAILAMAVAGFGGSLTPPGPPASTMKTLDQVEPAKPLAGPVPIAITQPGSYYLAENVTGVPGQPGISIQSSNVTLDLRGFSLTGVPGSGYGIVVSGGLQRVAIRNGIIQSWGFKGISAYDTVSCRLEDLIVSSCGSGGVDVGPGSVVSNCTLESNFSLALAIGDTGTVTGCRVLNTKSTGTGISAGRDCRIVDCVVKGNPNGFGVVAQAGLNITGCVLSGNGEGISAGEFASISKCVVHDASDNGLQLTGNSTVSDCTVTSCGTNGIYSAQGKCLISRCCISDCKWNGVHAFGNSSILDCEITSNTRSGILVSGGNCTVRGNSCSLNGTTATHAGIYVNGANSCVEDNIVVQNTWGISCTSTSGNIVVRNRARGNTTGNYAQGSGNFWGTVVTSEATMNSATNSNINLSMP